MIFNLLSAVESTSAGTGNGNDTFPWFWILMGVLIVFIIASNAMNNKKRRAQIEAEREKRNAIEPGFKVTTIGGIMGTVVEVDNEANTFVLQTGSDAFPCYLKFDKVAIYSSEDPNAPAEEPVQEDVFEENADNAVEEAKEDVVDETADEVVDETADEVVDETKEESAE